MTRLASIHSRGARPCTCLMSLALSIGACSRDGGSDGGNDDGPAAEPVYVRDVVVATSPLSLDNPEDYAVSWPLWGGSFTADEPVSLRVAMEATDAGLAFGIAGEEALARNVALVRSGDASWQLQLRDEDGVHDAIDLPDPSAQGLQLTFAAGGGEVEVSTADGSVQRLGVDPPLAPDGEEIGAYVHLDPGATLGLAEVAITQTGEAGPELDPPLRDLAQGHGITIGTATDVWPPLHDRTFEHMLGAQFDLAAPSEFYWTTTRTREDAFFFVPADLMVNYAIVHGQRIRGYHLVWDLELPQWLLDIVEAGDYDGTEAALRDHVWTIVDRYKGRVAEWVVVNEAIWGPEVTGDPDTAEWAESPWTEVLGVEYIEMAFEEARIADPDAILLYNETDADTLGAKSDFMLAMVIDFVARGVPIDGVGLQFHLNAAAPPDPADLAANMQRFVDAGVDVYITELDVNLVEVEGTPEDELELQATIYADVLDACLSVPGCRSYTTWGFSDRHAWYEREGGAEAPLLLDAEYDPKPAFFAVQQRLAE